MQYHLSEYDINAHDKFKCLTVKQPYASSLIDGSKTIEVRSKYTKYRGDILICSSKNPIIKDMPEGCTIGFIELYGIKPIEQFTPEDWENTRISPEDREKIKTGFGWLMRNPRRVIEYPVSGQLGIYNLVYTKGVIMEYPKNVILERSDYENRRIQNKPK